MFNPNQWPKTLRPKVFKKNAKQNHGKMPDLKFAGRAELPKVSCGAFEGDVFFDGFLYYMLFFCFPFLGFHSFWLSFCFGGFHVFRCSFQTFFKYCSLLVFFYVFWVSIYLGFVF